MLFSDNIFYGNNVMKEILITMNNKLLAALIIPDVIFFDQLTKFFMIGRGPIDIIPNIFSFTYAENIGVAFSLPLIGTPQKLITVGLIAVLVVLYFRFKAYEKVLLNLGLALMLGGAIANAYDRFFRGFVIDFIKVGNFPVFNLADSAVTIGVVMILWYELRKNKTSA